jgi:hypothetical protein
VDPLLAQELGSTLESNANVIAVLLVGRQRQIEK